MGVIKNRRPSWEKKERIMSVLNDIQTLRNLCMVLHLPAEQFADIIYFVLDQFPVSEGQVVNGNVTDEWDEFEDRIPYYPIDEFYKRVMHPCNYKED